MTRIIHTANELLDAMQARCDAATDGPWSLEPLQWPGAFGVWGIRPDDELGDGEWLVTEVRSYEADAEFIAAARSDLPRLITAVRAVLEVHAHSEDYPQECRDGCGWPCPTVTTLTAALKEADDD